MQRKKKYFFFIRKWIDCGIISVRQLIGPDRYLTYNELKAKSNNVNTDYLLHEDVISANAVVKRYRLNNTLRLYCKRCRLKQ